MRRRRALRCDRRRKAALCAGARGSFIYSLLLLPLHTTRPPAATHSLPHPSPPPPPPPTCTPKTPHHELRGPPGRVPGQDLGRRVSGRAKWESEAPAAAAAAAAAAAPAAAAPPLPHSNSPPCLPAARSRRHGDPDAGEGAAEAVVGPPRVPLPPFARARSPTCRASRPRHPPSSLPTGGLTSGEKSAVARGYMPKTAEVRGVDGVAGCSWWQWCLPLSLPPTTQLGLPSLSSPRLNPPRCTLTGGTFPPLPFPSGRAMRPSRRPPSSMRPRRAWSWTRGPAALSERL